MLNKTAQQEYANAIQKIAYVHNIAPYALDEFLTKQANPQQAQQMQQQGGQQMQQRMNPQEIKRIIQRHPQPEKLMGLIQQLMAGIKRQGGRMMQGAQGLMQQQQQGGDQ